MVSGLLVSGCATYTWRHPEYTPEKWARERYECERDARQSGYFGTGIYGALNMQAFFERCLESKGWVKTKNEPQTAYTPAPQTQPQTTYTPTSQYQPSREFDDIAWFRSLSQDYKRKLNDEYAMAKKENEDLTWPEFLKRKREGSGGPGYHWEKDEKGNPVYVPHK